MGFELKQQAAHVSLSMHDIVLLARQILSITHCHAALLLAWQPLSAAQEELDGDAEDA